MTLSLSCPCSEPVCYIKACLTHQHQSVNYFLNPAYLSPSEQFLSTCEGIAAVCHTVSFHSSAVSQLSPMPRPLSFFLLILVFFGNSNINTLFTVTEKLGKGPNLLSNVTTLNNVSSKFKGTDTLIYTAECSHASFRNREKSVFGIFFVLYQDFKL